MTTPSVVLRKAGPHRSRRRRRIDLRIILLTVFAIPWIGLPFWMLLVNSFKTENDAAQLSIALPKHWAAASNFATVIEQGHYLRSLGNSALIAIPTILAILFLGSMAAWSYARSRSRSLKVTYYISALSIVLPPAIIPTVYVLAQIGINGTRLGYFLTLVGTRLGIVIFLATGFLSTLSEDYESAAQVDGASRWRIYRHIILPLLSPLLFTSAVMLIIAVWNDFFFALYLLRDPASATLPLQLYQFASTGVYGVAWNLVFANVVLTSLPLVIAYVVLQRRVLGGLTEGGVTG